VRITLNGQPTEYDAPLTVAGLVTDRLGHDARGIAVAVNECVVPRARHAAYTLGDGDVVEIVTAVQGG
jgi:sulfur carrier protein